MSTGKVENINSKARFIEVDISEDYFDEINVYTCELMCHDENFIDTFMDIHPNGIGGYGYGRKGAVYPTDDMELTVYQPIK